jgi:hypothetical protein
MDEREIDGGRRGLLTSALTSIDRRRTAAFLSLSELRAEEGKDLERKGSVIAVQSFTSHFIYT